MKIIKTATGPVILKDEQFENVGKEYLKEKGVDIHGASEALAREAVKAEMQALTTENTRLKKENADLLKEKAGFEGKLKQVEASVNTRASRMAADISRSAGLEAPIPIAGVTAESHGLRDKLAAETDPTRKANIAREIKRVETESKKIA